MSEALKPLFFSPDEAAELRRLAEQTAAGADREAYKRLAALHAHHAGKAAQAVEKGWTAAEKKELKAALFTGSALVSAFAAGIAERPALVGAALICTVVGMAATFSEGLNPESSSTSPVVETTQHEYQAQHILGLMQGHPGQPQGEQP